MSKTKKTVSPVISDILENTERAQALEVYNRHASEIRYNRDRGTFLVWRNNRWIDDPKSSIVREIVGRMASERSKTLNPDMEGIRSTVDRLNSAGFCNGVVKILTGFEGIETRAEHWDADPNLIGTPSGVVNLRTGEIREMLPEDLITNVTGCAPDFSASCQAWEHFLFEACAGDQEQVDFLQVWCGYNLYGRLSTQKFVILKGEGSNGKSVIAEILQLIMGSYHRTLQSASLMVSAVDKIPADLAALVGARCVTVSETEAGGKFAESRLRQMTGGDPISCRFMRENFFTYKPQFKLTMAYNDIPALSPTPANRRRTIILQIKSKPTEIVMDLAKELFESEGPAILAWMISGAQRYFKEGLPTCSMADLETAEFFDVTKRNATGINEFVEDCVETGLIRSRVSASDMCEMYFAWSAAFRKEEKPDDEEDDEPPIRRTLISSSTTFGREITKKFPKIKSHGTLMYLGVRLKSSDTIAVNIRNRLANMKRANADDMEIDSRARAIFETMKGIISG